MTKPGNETTGKTVSLYVLLNALICLVIVIAMALFWPVKLFEFHSVIHGGTEVEMLLKLDGEAPYTLPLTPPLPYLDSLSFYAEELSPTNKVHIRLWGASRAPIFDEYIDFEGTTPGMVTIRPGLILEPGLEYTLQFWDNEKKGDYFRPVFGLDRNGMMVSDFYYSAPLSLKRILFYDLLVLLPGAALLYGLYRLKDKSFMQRELSLPLIGGITALLFWGAGSVLIFGISLFGTDPVNKVFLELGLTLFSLLIPLIFREGAPKPSLPVCFLTGVFLSCIAYQNALSDFEHYVYYRSFLIFLGLFLGALAFNRELLNALKDHKKTLIPLVLLLIAMSAAYMIRSRIMIGDPLLAFENAAVFTIWTLLVYIAIVSGAAQKWAKGIRSRKISLETMIYRGLISLFLLCVVLFANGRLWPLFFLGSMLAALLWLRLYEIPAAGFLNMVESGMLLSFAWVLLYSLLHRPYHAYILYRYGMTFHTVTMTSVYLLGVLACAAVRFFRKWDGSFKGLAKVPLELGAFGSASAFLIMTYSRTGFVAAAATVFCLVVGAGAIKLKQGGPGAVIAEVIKLGAIWLAAAFLFFPVCFTAARTIPAMIVRPEMYWIEPFDGAIQRGTAPDSEYYMSIQRFLQVLGIKARGLPEFMGETWITKEEFSAPEPVLIASADDSAGLRGVLLSEPLPENPVDENVSADQYTNGRLSIFKAYLSQLNLKGHEEMGAVLEGGNLAIHAHNIYLQIAFDNGIPTGVIFLLLMLFTLYRGWRFKERSLLPLVLTAAFMAVGMAEWVSHMCNPLCVAAVLSILPLTSDIDI